VHHSERNEMHHEALRHFEALSTRRPFTQFAHGALRAVDKLCRRR
jgi:hypothetical protein